MTVADPNQASLLDLVGFSAAELAHPVDLLTVEMAALEADVSVTTVDSAITSAAAFRRHVLQAAIRSVATTPNATVWAALQRTVARQEEASSLADVLDARVQQLAEDPAFPLLLSGFERLDDAGTSAAVNDTLRALILELWPFIQTIRSAAGRPVPPDPTEDVLFSVVLCLVGQAMYRVLGLSDFSETADAFIQILAEFVDRVIDSPGKRASDVGSLLRQPAGQTSMVQGLAQQAVEAGVSLLRSDTIEPATSLTVADATARCEVSTASFYRIFGSMAEFERQLLEQVGGSLADGFGEHFFAEDLHGMDAGTDDPPNMAHVMAAYYARAHDRHRRHVETGRPGVELLPWLNSPVLGPLVRASYQKRFSERGSFFARLATSLGTELTGGLTGDVLASFMGVSSITIELFLRNAPDLEQAEAYFVERSAQYFEMIFLEGSKS